MGDYIPDAAREIGVVSGAVGKQTTA